MAAVTFIVGNAGVAEQHLNGVEHLAPVGTKAVEGPGPDQVFHLALVDRVGVEALGEVEQVLEGAVGPASPDQSFHGRFADVLDRRQGVTDSSFVPTVAPFDHKDGVRGIDVRPQKLDSHLPEFLMEDAQFVRIAHFQGHQRGHEFNRVVGLHVSRLVGDQGIGGCVGFVEAVTGEFTDLFENIVGLGFWNALADGTVDEGLALLRHLRADFLAHGPTQDIGAAKRIPRQLLCDLHHLFLIDHDTEGFLEDSFERRIEVIRRFLTVFALNVAGDVVHRPRTVKGDDGDDVLEGIGLELLQNVFAHARRFQLEHPGGVAPPYHFVSLAVVEGDAGDVKVVACLANHLFRLC